MKPLKTKSQDGFAVKNAPNFARDNSGFTLVELLMAMALLAFILAILTVLYLDVYRTYGSTIAARTTQAEARFSVDELARRLRNANSLEVVSPELVCFSDNSDRNVFRARVTGAPEERLIVEQLQNDTDCSDSDNEDSYQYLTSENVLVKNLTFAVIGEELAAPSVFLSLDVATNTPDLFNSTEETCEPTRAGARYCSTARFTTIVTMRSL